MKTKFLFLTFIICAAAVAGLILLRRSNTPRRTDRHTAPGKQTVSQPATATVRVPAHYKEVPSLSSLGSTLAPEQFTGLTRDAYRAVKAIPQTIAQMPCYCHCDRGFGHKSLHSCFEDDHAAHCAVCVDEALVAYRLQQQGLSAPQIREQIIAQFGG